MSEMQSDKYMDRNNGYKWIGQPLHALSFIFFFSVLYFRSLTAAVVAAERKVTSVCFRFSLRYDKQLMYREN
jgi:hypothetical protein